MIKEYLAKYFTNLASIITLAGVVFLGWHMWNAQELARKERLLLEERYSRLIGSKVSGEKLGDSKAYQLAVEYKEQVKLAKELAKEWKELAIERGERVKLKSNAEINIEENATEQKGHDYEFLTKKGKKGYTLNELRIDGEDSPPIGYVLVKKNGKVFKKNYKFKIKVESVQLKDDLTGKVRVVSRAFLVPLENGLAEKRRPDLKKWKGEKYPLNVSGGVTTVDPHEPLVPEINEKGMVYWPMNANVGLGVFSVGGDTESRTMFDLSLLGYGYSKQDLDWKFLNLGINHSNDYGVGIHISPFTYRFAPDILTNTYFGPGYWDNGNKDRGYFFSLQVGL